MHGFSVKTYQIKCKIIAPKMSTILYYKSRCACMCSNDFHWFLAYTRFEVYRRFSWILTKYGCLRVLASILAVPGIITFCTLPRCWRGARRLALSNLILALLFPYSSFNLVPLRHILQSSKLSTTSCSILVESTPDCFIRLANVENRLCSAFLALLFFFILLTSSLISSMAFLQLQYFACTSSVLSKIPTFLPFHSSFWSTWLYSWVV